MAKLNAAFRPARQAHGVTSITAAKINIPTSAIYDFAFRFAAARSNTRF